MRNIFLLGTTLAVLAFGAGNAHAMGGSGNLAPSESPYAILEPQTVTPTEIATPPTEASPARTPHSPAKRRVHLRQ
ncbi:hypothetical protein [Methylocapsa sp. S129]|uniref:hypothetical protein n=1 Tax=Methylocapsa sp. S129 TaxID=1641869 RepID=UPI00131CDCE6|nr:hypothetical protein [Methylocapsa sp. S129]